MWLVFLGRGTDRENFSNDYEFEICSFTNHNPVFAIVNFRLDRVFS